MYNFVNRRTFYLLQVKTDFKISAQRSLFEIDFNKYLLSENYKWVHFIVDEGQFSYKLVQL